MIEEMAQYLKGYLYPLDNNSIENCRILASALISQGWVKLPKDSVVLSREEFWKLSNKFSKKELDEIVEFHKKKASKETAEKILRELKHSEFKFTIEINRSSQKDVSKVLEEFRKSVFGKINDLAKQFGVDLGE